MVVRPYRTGVQRLCTPTCDYRNSITQLGVRGTGVRTREYPHYDPTIDIENRLVKLERSIVKGTDNLFLLLSWMKYPTNILSYTVLGTLRESFRGLYILS